MTKLILVVNNDEAQAWLLAHTILCERRYNTLFAAGCSQALYLVQLIRPDLLIFDYRLTPSEGFQCYDALLARVSATSLPTIFISAIREPIEHEVKRRNLLLLEPPLERCQLLDLVDQLLM
jgi:CheY-like chemotaxis protein